METESDDFFELGGDSLIGMNIVADLNAHGYEVTVRELFAFSKAMDLAAERK